ncbi:hypothetical protein JCM11672_22500 [Alkaliphilus crotonatoxidans]
MLFDDIFVNFFCFTVLYETLRGNMSYFLNLSLFAIPLNTAIITINLFVAKTLSIAYSLKLD